MTRDMSVWGGLHILPRGAPSRGAKLCTYLQWFAWPDRVNTEPYYELPLPVTKLRCSSGWGPKTSQLSRAAWQDLQSRDICDSALCAPGMLLGMRGILLLVECPQFDDIRAQYLDLLHDARDSMRNLMWHQNQKALSGLVIAILDEPRT